MFVVMTLAVTLGYRFSGWRGARCVSLAWLGFCLVCAFGYEAGGIAGLALITLPSLVLFWMCLYSVAPMLLPIGDSPSGENRRQAFRALLTYALGTNYPYYTVENRKAILRMSGNQFRRFFAGPGIIMTSCDHTVVVSDGMTIKGVTEPGFSFTHSFESIVDVIDLRDQLRAFVVEAITRDGIRIKVLAFVAFRISRGDKRPELGESFPCSESAVLRAMRESTVERSRESKDGKVVEHKYKHTWDKVVPVIATQVLRRIINEYSFDDLCAALQPERNPRYEIMTEFQRQLRDRLGAIGIELVRGGGGISNLLPADYQPLQQRIRYWQAGQERRSMAETAKGAAEYIRIVESARTQTREEAEQMTSDTFDKTRSVDKNVSAEEIALRFIEVLERLVDNLTMQPPLPPASFETLEAMRRAIETRQH